MDGEGGVAETGKEQRGRRKANSPVRSADQCREPEESCWAECAEVWADGPWGRGEPCREAGKSSPGRIHCSQPLLSIYWKRGKNLEDLSIDKITFMLKQKLICEFNFFKQFGKCYMQNYFLKTLILLLGFSQWNWSRKWQLTPIFLPGKFHDRGIWWATIHGVTKSWTCLSAHAHTHTHRHTHTTHLESRGLAHDKGESGVTHHLVGPRTRSHPGASAQPEAQCCRTGWGTLG